MIILSLAPMVASTVANGPRSPWDAISLIIMFRIWRVKRVIDGECPAGGGGEGAEVVAVHLRKEDSGWYSLCGVGLEVTHRIEEAKPALSLGIPKLPTQSCVILTHECPTSQPMQLAIW